MVLYVLAENRVKAVILHAGFDVLRVDLSPQKRDFIFQPGLQTSAYRRSPHSIGTNIDWS